jgi:hypothetical protein
MRAVCLYKINQRECINGFYLATPEDYKTACGVYQETTVQNNTNLTKNEQAIVTIFIKKNQNSGFYDKSNNMNPKKAVRLTYEDIAIEIGITTGAIKNIFSKKNERSHGLEGKVIGFGSESSTDGTRKTLIYYTGKAEFEMYQTFSSLTSDTDILRFTEEAKNLWSQETADEDEITKEAFLNLVESMPTLPVINRHNLGFDNNSPNVITVIQPSYYQTMTDEKKKNNNSIINNNIDSRSIIVNKENGPESKTFACITEDLEENKEVTNLEDNRCKNSNNTLISQNQDDCLVRPSNDNEIPSYRASMTVNYTHDGSSTDSETQTITVKPKVSNLQYITGKIKEYLNKECKGSTITKSIDTHINDFIKLNPEFKKESRQHLEFAFSKVLKSTPESPKKSKGIELLEKALQSGKKEAAV